MLLLDSTHVIVSGSPGTSSIGVNSVAAGLEHTFMVCCTFADVVHVFICLDCPLLDLLNNTGGHIE